MEEVKHSGLAFAQSSGSSPVGMDNQSFGSSSGDGGESQEGSCDEETIWSRLTLAVDGHVQLTADDASTILRAFRETLENEEQQKAGRGRRREDIIDKMKYELHDNNDDVLNYLTCHYLPMDTAASLDAESVEVGRRGSICSACMQGGSIVLLDGAIHNWRAIADGFVKLFGGDSDRLLAAFEQSVRSGTSLDEEDIIDMVHKAASSAASLGDSASTQRQVEKFVESLFQHQICFTFDEFSKKLEETNELITLLGSVSNWGFDVFALSKLTASPLKVMGIAAAKEVKMFDRNDFDVDKYESFLGEVEASYCKNPYHNNLHAADVVQTCLHFLTKGQIMEASGISSLATAGLLIAAAVHDVGHPGSNNHFLISTSAPLAVQYNDHSPLENMHLATAFTIMHKAGNNFIERLSPFLKKELRRIIIAMVLATDNDRHFATHEKLEGLVNSQRASMGLWETDGSMDLSGFPRDRKQSVCTLTRIESGTEYESDDDYGLPMTSPNTTGTGGGSVPTSNSSLLSHSAKRNSYPGGAEHRGDGRIADDVSVRRSSMSHSSVLNDSEHAGVGAQRSGVTPPAPEDSPLLGYSGRSFSRFKSISQTKLLSRPPSLHMLTRKGSGGSAHGLAGGSVHGLAGGSMGSGEKSAQASSSTPSDPTQLLLLESALHMADISNPVKPWDVYQQWLSRVMEEFYHQGDHERELELPMTFGFDRTNPIPQSKFQLGFIRVIVSPLYTTYSRLPGVALDHCLDSMGDNIAKWTLQAEQEGKDNPV